MLHCFNEASIYTKFIKGLLMNTYIPTVQVWKPNKYVMENFNYITRDYIVKAIKSFTGNGQLESIFNTEYFKIVEPYIDGNEYKNITTNFVSNSYEYDYETHKYLGEYLRMVRDLHDIDLMPYYNCATNKIADNIRIRYDKTNREYRVISDNIKDDGFKTIIVPIKFNQDYTIYINSSFPTKLTSIFYDGYNKVTQFKSDILEYSSMSFSKPVLYKVTQQPELNRNDMFYRKYLTLLVQVPKRCNQIIVLEGNYVNNKLKTSNLTNEVTQVYFGECDINDLPQTDIDNYCKVYPSLIRGLKNEMYAYSDRLIEYLLLNAITQEDDISKNIERVQSYISGYECDKFNGIRFKLPFTKGVWNNEMRLFIYNLVTKNFTNKKVDSITIDVNGFVDKDSESIITRGYNV